MSVPVQRVYIGYRDEVNIDWSGYSRTTPEVLPTTGPKKLRPHQTRALDDVRRGLAEHERGKPVMACGTGKTFTSLRIAEHLVGEGGSVLFPVQSSQLMLWSRHLAWLKNDPPDRVCRVLTNARCLCEGVDGQAPDAVLFLQPRGSQVDVVQSVGRVMRRRQARSPATSSCQSSSRPASSRRRRCATTSVTAWCGRWRSAVDKSRL